MTARPFWTMTRMPADEELKMWRRLQSWRRLAIFLLVMLYVGWALVAMVAHKSACETIPVKPHFHGEPMIELDGVPMQLPRNPYLLNDVHGTPTPDPSWGHA